MEVGDGQVMDFPLLKAKAVHSSYDHLFLPKAIYRNDLVRNSLRNSRRMNLNGFKVYHRVGDPHTMTTETSQRPTIHQ